MCIENQDAYERAIRRNIKANAAKTRRKEWFSKHDDAQRLYDWLNGCGEFDNIYVSDSGNVYSYEDLHDGIPEEFHVQHNPYCEGMFAGKFGSFLLTLRDNLHEYGGLTDKQTDVVRNAFLRKCQNVAAYNRRKIEERERNLKSKFVGEINERRKFDLVIKFIASFESRYGTTYINVMEDCDGNVIVGKGTKRYGEKGQSIKVVATITKHNIREGVEQTIINRPKFIEE